MTICIFLAANLCRVELCGRGCEALRDQAALVAADEVMSGIAGGGCIGSVVDGDRVALGKLCSLARRVPVDARTPPPSASFSIMASSVVTDRAALPSPAPRRARRGARRR